MQQAFLFRIVIMCFILLPFSVSQAKELALKLQVNSSYPMKVHYKFSNSQNLYAEGDINFIKYNEVQYVYVNRVPDKEDILIQINKMNVANRTEFNDPCEIKLDKDSLDATIIVGFKGDPESHGSFTCNIPEG